MGKLKFEFGKDFQELILKYTATEKKGHKALELYEDDYFGTMDHAVIAHAMKKYYKKRKRVPEEPMLRETIRTLYVSSSKELFSALTDEDRDSIDQCVARIYSGRVADPDMVLEKCITFARYAAFKDELEKVDISKFDSYAAHIDKLNKANGIGKNIESKYGTLLIAGMPDRAYKRDLLSEGYETPFWQYNRTLNSGVLPVSSVVIIAAQAKRFKTGFLLNLCKGLMKRKRKILFIDFENGEQGLTTRSEQNLISVKSEQITSGDMDDKLLKLARKYKRIGGEVNFKRMVAFVNDCNDIQTHIDMFWEDLGIKFTDLIIDNPDLMASISKKTEEVHRISDAYIDVKNLAEKNKFFSTWCPSHVKNEKDTIRRRGTCYTQGDMAKCTDKVRWVDSVLGLQENDEEKENGIMRVEIIDQRHGRPNGAALFFINMETQTMKEFTKAQVKEYWSQNNNEEKSMKPKDKKTDL